MKAQIRLYLARLARGVLPKELAEYVSHRGFLSSLPRATRIIIQSLRSGDVCVDCGANVGSTTLSFARYGAYVYAFEPDPWAMSELALNVSGNARVKCIRAAVGTVEGGRQRLYLHKEAALDPIKGSQGSSLLASKPNVGDRFVDVDTVDLAGFIKRLGKVRILKIDIEGFETVLLPHLLKTGALEFVDYVFIETHDRKWPELRKDTELMKKLALESKCRAKIFFDWV